MLIGAPLSAKPLETGGVFEFVGFTTIETRDGNDGIVAMHEACQIEFGPDTRMCTTEEYFRSPNAEGTATPAWIQGTSYSSTQDWTGVSDLNNCFFWSAASGSSVWSVGANGHLVLSLCSGARPITCCARVN